MEANAFDMVGVYMFIPMFKLMLASILMTSAITHPIGVALLMLSF